MKPVAFFDTDSAQFKDLLKYTVTILAGIILLGVAFDLFMLCRTSPQTRSNDGYYPQSPAGKGVLLYKNFSFYEKMIFLLGLLRTIFKI